MISLWVENVEMYLNWYISAKIRSGFSAARLAHHFRVVGAAGSNPVIPTNKQSLEKVSAFFYFKALPVLIQTGWEPAGVVGSKS